MKISFRENCTICTYVKVQRVPLLAVAMRQEGSLLQLSTAAECPLMCVVLHYKRTYLERIICQIEISILVFSSCAACSVQTYVD